MSTDLDALLDVTTRALIDEFDGVIGPEAVGRCLRDSYVALHRTAFANPELPELARRFATDRLTALAQQTGRLRKAAPEVLFICIHNAGRSQMAAALMDAHAQGTVRVHSAGSKPDPAPSASAATVLAELGVSMAGAYPKPITDDVLRAVDVVVIAGGREAVPVVTGPRYDIWDLPHPAGDDLAGVRLVRDEINLRVQALLTELTKGSPLTELAQSSQVTEG
ncbi:MAG TPA: arsenate reductase ArsC [Actinoplanes sp.]|nr:arsenate reductase ArsC [Actinoplanes sp.]